MPQRLSPSWRWQVYWGLTLELLELLMHTNAKKDRIDNPRSMWDATFAQRTTCYDKTQWLVGASRQLTRVTTALTSGHLLVLAHSNSLPDQRGPNIDHGTMPPGQSALVISCDCHKDWKQSTWGCSKTSQLPGCILPGFSTAFRFKACRHKTIHLPTRHETHETWTC